MFWEMTGHVTEWNSFSGKFSLALNKKNLKKKKLKKILQYLNFCIYCMDLLQNKRHLKFKNIILIISILTNLISEVDATKWMLNMTWVYITQWNKLRSKSVKEFWRTAFICFISNKSWHANLIAVYHGILKHVVILIFIMYLTWFFIIAFLKK